MNSRFFNSSFCSHCLTLNPRISLLLGLLANEGLVVRAEAVEQKPEEKQNVIVVTGTRTPQLIMDSPVAVEVIGPKDLAQSPAKDGAGLAAQASGLMLSHKFKGVVSPFSFRVSRANTC